MLSRQFLQFDAAADGYIKSSSVVGSFFSIFVSFSDCCQVGIVL